MPAESLEHADLATRYRKDCRAPESSAALDARILAAARVHADLQQSVRRRARRQRFWRVGAPWFAGCALMLLVLVVSLPRGGAIDSGNVLLPASIGVSSLADNPARPLPDLQVPAQAPASRQADDPCRLQVAVEAAASPLMQQEIARLKAMGCAATLVGLAAQSAAVAK